MRKTMAIGFTKSYFDKQVSEKKSSSGDYQFHGYSGGKSFTERVSDVNISYNQMHLMYVTNVWVRACIDKIVERFANIEPIIKPVNIEMESGELDDDTKKNMETIQEFLLTPNSNYESLSNLRKKWSRDILKFDGTGIEILKGVDVGKAVRFVEMYSVPGNLIKINTDKKGILNKSAAYVQIDSSMNKVASWKPNQFIYSMNNPQSNRIYGFSPLETLVQTVTAELFASQFNLDFFQNNATPRFAVLMEGLGIGQGSSALKRVRNWWDNELQGKPHRPIIMGTEQGKVSLQKVGLSNEEMQFQQYSAYLLTKIMAIFKLQPIVLGIVGMANAGSSGGATSNVEEQMRQFKLDAIQPLLKTYWGGINSRIVFDKSVLDIRNVYVDYDLDLVDKKSQAEWHDQYLQDGVITINEIRTVGLGLRPVPWGNVPYMQNNLAPFGQGKNGQVVPGNQAEADADAENNSGDIATITQSTTRGDLEKLLANESGDPVGWEKMPIRKRLEAVELLIKEREKYLSKVWSFPKKEVISSDKK